MSAQAGARWEMHLGRAEDVLPGLERNVSLVLTDPPYGVRYVSGRSGPVSGRPIAGDDDADFVYGVLTASTRLYAGRHLHMYVFGDFDLTRVRGIHGQAELIWDKGRPGMGDLTSTWAPSYEHIQFCRGGTSARETPGFLCKRRGMVLRYPNITGRASRRHPTEKPVPLLRELIEVSSRFGELVLDPFAGSGSTGVAAILEGRRFVGIELEEDYFATACARLRAAERAWADQAAADQAAA